MIDSSLFRNKHRVCLNQKNIYLQIDFGSANGSVFTFSYRLSLGIFFVITSLIWYLNACGHSVYDSFLYLR